ncbi:hypothetical protein D3C72_2042050 [compost metagenome]
MLEQEGLYSLLAISQVGITYLDLHHPRHRADADLFDGRSGDWGGKDGDGAT